MIPVRMQNLRLKQSHILVIVDDGHQKNNCILI